MRYALLFAVLATPALSETSLSAQQFDDMTRGKTFYYAENGADYGGEEYLENRRVRWSFLDGRCKDGEWFPQDDQICFVYEDDPTPQCWSFYDSPAGLVARFRNDPGLTTLYETRQSAKPMMCLGPDVGV